MSTPSPFDSLLQNVAGDDPRTSMILNALQQAMQSNADGNELVTLRARVESLSRSCECLQRRLVAIAAALGACPRCMGENPSCRTCDGDGVPGALRPELQSFQRYVVPAVRRYRAAPARTSQIQHANAEEPN